MRSRLSGILFCLVLCYPATTVAEIYRWQDAEGAIHYGDSPPLGAHKLKQFPPNTYDSGGLVASVIDGDTLKLADGRRVRLLGIDTPEVAHHGQAGEPLGEQARRFLKKQIEGKRVHLRYDLQRRDHYQRLLAHLFLENGENINAKLLERGLAHALFKWPNLKNAEHYYTLESEARRQGSGVWALPSYQVRPMQNLGALRNRFMRLRGQVAQLIHQRRYTYLLFGDKLRVAVKRTRLELFRQAGIDLDALAGRWVTLRGWLGQRRGTPYLELQHPFQLERIE